MANKKENLKLRTWYSNRYQVVLVQKKLLSFFSIFSIATVVIAVIFVKQFTESKSFEPYVIELEEKTGIMTVVENLNGSNLIADEAVKRSYIFSFLNVAEGYNYVTFNKDRKTLLLFSSGNVYKQLYNKYSIRNETSIVNSLKEKGTMDIKIKSILFNTPTIATVRFIVYNTRPSKLYPAEVHKIAEIQFQFVDMKLNTDDRYINPLGFQVIKYTVGEDINI
ncbi:MAG: hypothetical protein J6C50_04615 [Rickettsiales bacterium]|nr:hypothetical protein [Rickettsiales bacterium]